jgi:hypothetical protein
MDMNTKTTATKPVNETYEKISAATTEAADVIKNSYSTAVKGAQDYNNPALPFKADITWTLQNVRYVPIGDSTKRQ